MKKFERSLLLFIALILVLSMGGSYLAFQSTKTSKSAQDIERMTIALVNEDDGAEFKGQQYNFGTEFIKNIEKDEGQDWYVVSRGAAESGMREDKYTMMILIPNDFSQKALSIDSKNPEKVSLNYKVNTKGSGNAKAKADQTASVILGDFNRRIIDVYFASVIGNLHAAQDRIGKMMAKEQAYTNLFQKDINHPLSSYTSQFNMLKEGAGGTKSGFKGLKDILSEFETSLASGNQTNETFYSQMQDFMKLAEANTRNGQQFSIALEQYFQEMNSPEVMDRMDALVSANTAMKQQFLQQDLNSATIQNEAEALQAYLDTTKERFGQIEKDIAEQLSADLQKSIADKMRSQIKMASGKEQDVYLSQIFSSIEENTMEKLKKQIEKLPSLKFEDIENLGFQESTTNQLSNVIAVTQKYNKEFQYTPAKPSSGMPLINQIREVKSDLTKNGVSISDTAAIPAITQSGQQLSVTLPDAFEVRQLQVTLPNTGEMDYTMQYKQGGKIFLPSSGEGSMTIRIHAGLKEGAKIDVLEPLTWSWQLQQEDSTETIQRKNTETAKKAAVKKTAAGSKDVKADSQKDMEQSNKNSSSEETGESTDEEGVQEEGQTPIDQKVQPDETPKQNDEKNSNDNKVQAEEKSETSKEKPPISSPIVVKNNYITHQVDSPLASNTTSRLINGALSTVSEYQKLLMLYEIYFGFDMNQSDLRGKLEAGTLKDLAEPRSFYYIFNKQDMADMLSSYVAEQITEEIRKETEEYKANVEEYLEIVNQADSNSKQLAELITFTAQQAEVLNQSVEEVLNRLTVWRDTNSVLQESQSEILSNGDAEYTAVADLGGEFSSILLESQSLAEQSKGNLEAADQVYLTIDEIENKADTINNSGASIVEKAGELSENLTEKLATDKDFASNFAAVLANSRIGKRQNENLLDFLSNPVETRNAGIKVTDETEIPYFVVLICFIGALFTAYVISHLERKPKETDAFEGEQTLAARNMPVAMMTAGIGLAEGLLIGFMTGYLLEVEGRTLVIWTALLALIMLAMVLIATYLLRQLKMIGMFVLLGVLSMYLLLTEAAGTNFNKQSLVYRLREYSPLQYIEQLLNGFLAGSQRQMLIVICLAVIAAAGAAGQLLVINRTHASGNGVSENEEAGV